MSTPARKSRIAQVWRLRGILRNRHTTAMTRLQSEISTSVIALWLGHEQEQTTRGYLHGDLRLKQRALDRTTPQDTKPGRYRASDKLLRFLDNL
jgi:integrase